MGWSRFRVAAYDLARPLVIDPVLVYSTYLGGSRADWGADIAVDAAGNAYVVGTTMSTDFPLRGPSWEGGDASNDVFVTKLNAAGSDLVYSVHFGGSITCVGGFPDNYGSGIAVDAAGAAYVTGSTNAYNFPMVSPLFRKTGADRGVLIPPS